MPHVTVDSRLDLRELARGFAPILHREPLVRVPEIYVDRAGRSALLPAVAIDSRHQEYFIEISASAARTTIRLCPRTDPAKTDAVRLSLELVYRQAAARFPGLRILRTNLPGLGGAGA